ncbi:LAO/AO transport system kinase [gamma proteobacterium HdN1]|nr:LAO/AO transport system kinase [gamma proteobacterium HdN1]
MSLATFDVDGLLAGARRPLAKAITLIESRLDAHRQLAQQLLAQILPQTGRSIRIGITGVPGVGKSSFVEAFGCHLVELGKKVAVLAVDPSSPITGGSILGDKTRMERLSQSERAFIRPSPSYGSLGGVAEKTRETMLLCEAAGHDVILVETVGVGQSEYEVAGMVDFFLVLMLPNAGDELQGIKKGILELADAIVVNKADGVYATSAGIARRQYSNAMKLMQHRPLWTPRVLTCSALENTGIADIWQMIDEFHATMQKAGELEQRRARQNKDWMWKLVHELIQLRLQHHPKARSVAERMESQVISSQITPLLAALDIVNALIPTQHA